VNPISLNTYIVSLQICAQRKDEWENFVSEFERHGQILKLVPVIPTREPKLEPECYETILKTALYTRPKLFRAIVGLWDGEELYRTRLHFFDSNFKTQKLIAIIFYAIFPNQF